MTSTSSLVGLILADAISALISIGFHPTVWSSDTSLSGISSVSVLVIVDSCISSVVVVVPSVLVPVPWLVLVELCDVPVCVSVSCATSVPSSVATSSVFVSCGVVCSSLAGCSAV